MSNAIFARLQTLIAERLDVPEENVTLDASFTETLGADSLEIVEFIMELEDEFDIEIPDEDAEGLRTVQDVVTYIEQHQ